MKRGTLTITVAVCIILAMLLHNSMNKVEEQSITIEEANNDFWTLDSLYTVKDSLYQAQSQANLRIMYLINAREEKKLEQDSIYMSLTDKIN